MCKRYVSPDEVTIEKEFDLVPSEWRFAANYNVSPTQAVPVIRVVESQPDPLLLTWGFGDHGTSIVAVEMLNLDAGDRSLLTRGQRCIIPALGYYEWRSGTGHSGLASDGTGAAMRPFYLHVEDQPVFGFAGLWERECCTLITVPANPMVAEIDREGRRMPAILPVELRDVWLYGSVLLAATALGSYPAERMVAYAVTARVDSLANNDESLIEPLETDVD